YPQDMNTGQLAIFTIGTPNIHWSPFWGINRVRLRKLRIEDFVDPVENWSDRAKVGREWYHRATFVDDLFDLIVGDDVGPAETINRLLGVTDHEQRSGFRYALSPIGLVRIVRG